MLIGSRSRAGWTAALPVAASLVASLAISTAGCSSKPSTQPTAPPPTGRQVSATVEDTAGVRVSSGHDVIALRLDAIDSAFQLTDSAGVAHFTLADGRWCLYASVTPTGSPTLVAGAIGPVGHRPPPAADSVLFRLVLRPESIARGKITLSGQATHAGTLVGAAELPLVVSTEADGSYELGGLPPGTWSGLATHLGYQPRLFDIVVPAPGDTITAGTSFVLVPGGPRP